VSSVERLVPVPRMSPAGSIVLSEIRASPHPPKALHNAWRASRIPLCDLPEMIANTWTWDDSPTSDLGDAQWIEVFRAAGFFSYLPAQGVIVMLPEKRKVGGSTPPLTTRSDHQRQRLTCVNAVRRCLSLSGWLRLFTAGGG
jgi:hypothetical protein